MDDWDEWRESERQGESEPGKSVIAPRYIDDDDDDDDLFIGYSVSKKYDLWPL